MVRAFEGKPPPLHIPPRGEPGVQPTKHLRIYGLSPNRLRPMAGFGLPSIKNWIRRIRMQFLYVVPPFVLTYWIINWANERNAYLNSKAGRAETSDHDE